MTLRAVLPRLSLGLAIIAGALWLALNRNQIDLALIENAMRALGAWGPVAHVLLFALGTILFVPGVLFALAGGMLFGPVWGTILNLAGATLGATAAFLAARYVTGDWVRRKAAGRLDRLIAGVEAEGWRFVAFVRLVPLIPFNLLNYALGLTRIPLVPYVLASLVCMAPRVPLPTRGLAMRGGKQPPATLQPFATDCSPWVCLPPSPFCRGWSAA